MTETPSLRRRRRVIIARWRRWKTTTQRTNVIAVSTQPAVALRNLKAHSPLLAKTQKKVCGGRHARGPLAEPGEPRETPRRSRHVVRPAAKLDAVRQDVAPRIVSGARGRGTGAMRTTLREGVRGRHHGRDARGDRGPRGGSNDPSKTARPASRPTGEQRPRGDGAAETRALARWRRPSYGALDRSGAAARHARRRHLGDGEEGAQHLFDALGGGAGRARHRKANLRRKARRKAADRPRGLQIAKTIALNTKVGERSARNRNNFQALMIRVSRAGVPSVPPPRFSRARSSPVAFYTFEPRPRRAPARVERVLGKVSTSDRQVHVTRACRRHGDDVRHVTTSTRHLTTKQRHTLEGRRAAADVGEVDEHVGAERVGDVVADVLERGLRPSPPPARRTRGTPSSRGDRS